MQFGGSCHALGPCSSLAEPARRGAGSVRLARSTGLEALMPLRIPEKRPAVSLQPVSTELLLATNWSISSDR